eukprot:tig00000402_g239.t1
MYELIDRPRPPPSSENAAGGGGGGGGGGELGARLSGRLVRLYGASRGALERAAPDRRQLRSRAAIAGALVNVLAASRTGTRAALESGLPAALIAAAEEAHAVASSLGPGGGGARSSCSRSPCSRTSRPARARPRPPSSPSASRRCSSGSGPSLPARARPSRWSCWAWWRTSGAPSVSALLLQLAGRARLGVAAHGAAFAALASMALVPEFRAALARTAFLADCAAALDRVARERAPASPPPPARSPFGGAPGLVGGGGGGEGVPAAAARQAAVLHFLGNLAFSQMRASSPSSAPRVPRPASAPAPLLELLEERRGAPAALRLALRAGAALLLRNLAFLQEAKPHILAPGQYPALFSPPHQRF